MDRDAVQQRFATALDGLIAQIKQDRSILAAILCGSLSHDVVWEKSDIDLVLVTVDDRRVASSHLPIYADGINVHANLLPRGEFRKTVDGATHNSFWHSLLAKGRLLYTHDPTIAALTARLTDIGARDTEVQLLRAATSALPSIDKAHKWFVTRGDLDYTALWILYAATPLARIEVVSRQLVADREVIPQALALNPAVFDPIYRQLINTPKTRPLVQAALDVVDAYLIERTPRLFAPILDHLRDVGEVRSSRDLEDHFTRHLNVEGVTTACEYLADRGLLAKASAPARLTKASNVDVQELAFFYAGV
jgi:hypothetical protein